MFTHTGRLACLSSIGNNLSEAFLSVCVSLKSNNSWRPQTLDVIWNPIPHENPKVILFGFQVCLSKCFANVTPLTNVIRIRRRQTRSLEKSGKLLRKYENFFVLSSSNRNTTGGLGKRKTTVGLSSFPNVYECFCNSIGTQERCFLLYLK